MDPESFSIASLARETASSIYVAWMMGVGRKETARPPETGKIISLEERGHPFWDGVPGGLCSKRHEFRIHYHLAGADAGVVIGGMRAASARHWIRV